jgi:hypothetical protein
MLALHLLQNCMVHTLMLQQVLAKPHWSGKLTARDLSALILTAELAVAERQQIIGRLGGGAGRADDGAVPSQGCGGS